MKDTMFNKYIKHTLYVEWYNYIRRLSRKFLYINFPTTVTVYMYVGQQMNVILSSKYLALVCLVRVSTYILRTHCAYTYNCRYICYSF